MLNIYNKILNIKQNVSKYHKKDNQVINILK